MKRVWKAFVYFVLPFKRDADALKALKKEMDTIFESDRLDVSLEERERNIKRLEALQIRLDNLEVASKYRCTNNKANLMAWGLWWFIFGTYIYSIVVNGEVTLYNFAWCGVSIVILISYYVSMKQKDEERRELFLETI